MRGMRLAAAVAMAAMMIFGVWTVRAEDQVVTRAEVEALLRSVMNGEVTVSEPTEAETMAVWTAPGVYGRECVKEGVCPTYHEGCKTRSAYSGVYSNHHRHSSRHSSHHKSSHGHCR